MIASNVYRRTIDAFSMFEYIGKLRNDVTNVTYRDIAKATHKNHNFASAADIFNKLPHVPRRHQREHAGTRQWDATARKESGS